MTQVSHEELVSTLLKCSKEIDPRQLFPVLIPDAADLALSNPYAFAMATCLDRGTRAEIIWTIPYYIKQDLGHFDPDRIHRMSHDELAALFSRLPRKPRYINAAPRTVRELTTIVIQEFGGDASLIWKGKRASEVKATFRRIFGVGPGIANMAVLLIEKAFGVRFGDLDRRHMDIKADVHLMRVLKRLGVSSEETEESAIEAARRLNPDYPGEIDAPLWVIGRTWCYATSPECLECRLGAVCPRVGVK